jgi:hypothetical protein
MLTQSREHGTHSRPKSPDKPDELSGLRHRLGGLDRPEIDLGEFQHLV